MTEYKTVLKYNPQTKRMESTRLEKKASSGGWVKGDITVHSE